MGKFVEEDDLNVVKAFYIPRKYPKLEKTHDEKIILDRYKYWLNLDVIPEHIISNFKRDIMHICRTIDYKNK